MFRLTIVLILFSCSAKSSPSPPQRSFLIGAYSPNGPASKFTCTDMLEAAALRKLGIHDDDGLSQVASDWCTADDFEQACKQCKSNPVWIVCDAYCRPAP